MYCVFCKNVLLPYWRMRLSMTPEEVFQLWFLCGFVKHKVPILVTFLIALLPHNNLWEKIILPFGSVYCPSWWGNLGSKDFNQLAHPLVGSRNSNVNAGAQCVLSLSFSLPPPSSLLPPSLPFSLPHFFPPALSLSSWSPHPIEWCHATRIQERLSPCT